MKPISYLLFCTLFCVSAGAQTEVKLPNIYFSTHLGIMPDDDLHASAELSLGYQFNKWLGTGLGYCSFTEIDMEPESFSGPVWQIRLLPTKRLVAVASIGTAIRYKHPYHGFVAPELVPGWHLFYKFYAGWRLGKSFMAGISIFRLSGATMELNDYELDSNGNKVWLDPQQFDEFMQAFQFTIGININ